MDAVQLRALDEEIAAKVFGILPRAVRVRGSDETVEIISDNPYHCDGACERHELLAVRPPSYSCDIAAAWTVVEQMNRRAGGIAAVVRFPEGGWGCRFGGTANVHGATASEAVCRAALKWFAENICAHGAVSPRPAASSQRSEPMVDEKRLRLFVRNPESGEPWAYCGTLDMSSPEVAQVWMKQLCFHIFAEMHGDFFSKDGDRFTLEVKRELMTDAEVAALPEM